MKYKHHCTGHRCQSAESGFDTARAIRVIAAAFGAKAASWEAGSQKLDASSGKLEGRSQNSDS